MQAEERPQTLAPLPGFIAEQFVCCNRERCRCRTGERHGPYFYRVWTEQGKVHKRYVKKNHLATVRQQILLYKQLRDERRQLARRPKQAGMGGRER